MNIAFIGAGRVATSMAVACREQGHRVELVYSRTEASARSLAERVGARHTTQLPSVADDVDVCIVALPDSVLSVAGPAVARRGSPRCLYLHTSGSLPASLFEGHARSYGVLYPMQTFSMERVVSFAHLPLFVEAGGEGDARDRLLQLAGSLSDRVQELSAEQRRQLHLAAVFACNFANHCYDLSARVLERVGLPFSVMHPLVEETARKVLGGMAPRLAQTGPAERGDANVLAAHEALLGEMPAELAVYRLMSRSIERLHNLQANESEDLKL